MIRLTTEAEAQKCKKTHDGKYPPVSGGAAFEVAGAGTVVIGQHEGRCAWANGLTFKVSWGQYGYAGGVMDREELVALRDYIDSYLNDAHKVGYSEDHSHARD